MAYSDYEEEVQVEQLKRWWSENWIPLVAGLVIGLIAVFGWQQWRARKERANVEASQLYDELTTDLSHDDLTAADAVGKKLVESYDRTPYAADAQLALASANFNVHHYDIAAQHLNWIKSNIKGEGMLALARLRLARVLWQEGKAEPALAELNGGAVADAGFAPLADELRGDIELSRGDRAKALAAYQSAMKLLPADALQRDDVQRKLDSVADAAAKLPVSTAGLAS